MDCALVARFGIADAGTDDNRHYTPLQRLRRHHQSPLPYNSLHLVLHCLYRTRLNLSPAHQLDTDFVLHPLSANFGTASQLCKYHPEYHAQQRRERAETH